MAENKETMEKSLLLQYGEVESYKEVIEKLNQAVEQGNTPLFKRILSKYSLEWLRKEPLNFIALHRACDLGHEDIVQALLDQGMSANSVYPGYHPRTSWTTALQVAASKGHLKIVKLLVDKGAGVNETSLTGQGGPEPTPLALAHKAGHEDVEKYLVEQGGIQGEMDDEVNLDAIAELMKNCLSTPTKPGS